MKYILWDWNGTLLDDTQAAIDALNVLLVRRGLRPPTRDDYRARFAFPVRPFYAEIGIVLENENWDALAREYHEAYAEQPKCLNAEAFAALETVRQAGCGQSILSALRQDLLDATTQHYGVAAYMDCIYGVDNLDGSSKLDRALELLTFLTARAKDGTPLDVVMIGDALHDKEVADALGVRCVLCAQGGHSAERLRRAAPTADTLTEAVRLALGPTGP